MLQFLIAPMVVLLAFSPFVAFLVMMFQTLSGAATHTVEEILTPLFVIEGIGLLGMIGTVRQISAGAGRDPNTLQQVISIWTTLPSLIAFEIYLIQKVDHQVPHSWQFVFTPLIVTQLLNVLVVSAAALHRLRTVILGTCTCTRSRFTLDEQPTLPPNPLLAVDGAVALNMQGFNH
jgi:hypothetical protein